MTVETRFGAALERLVQRPAALGLAVSGGSDSTALLHLAAGWAARHGVALHVATVDHGLRPEAAAEAEAVARAARALGASHVTLRWDGATAGNLMDAARRARLALLAGWAARVGPVLLGHTRDDVAEGLVIGLTRGAGLDGLARMRSGFAVDGVRFLRPMLELGRAELRDWLAGRGIGWVDDPTNADQSYLRARVRRVLGELDALGLDAAAIARSAGHLAAARCALDGVVLRWARDHVREEGGDLVLDPDAFAALDEETARRLLNAALRWVASADYPPRAESVTALRPIPRTGRTLHSCLIRPDKTGLRIGREPEAAARAARLDTGSGTDLWDGRWRITGPVGPDREVRATGAEGLAQRPDWRATRLPRATLLAGPALWAGNRLLCAPLIDPAPRPFDATLARGFLDSLANAD